MYKYLILIFVGYLLILSCNKPQTLEGDWRTSYFNGEAISQLKFFFNDFDLYTPTKYVPLIHIDKGHIEYALGIGLNKQKNFLSSSSNYFLSSSNILTIFNNEDKQSFKLEFSSKKEFCLFEKDKKVVCFTKINSIKECQVYSIELKIESEYYNHNLLVSNDGHFSLVRKGIKTYSLNQKLSLYEMSKINNLIRLVDIETDRDSEQNASGDYTEYELNLQCGEKNINRKFLGLRDISFGMRSLLLNMEMLSKAEYKSK